jgi:hypothetical protein
MPPRALASFPTSTAPSLTECAKESAVDRVVRAVKGDAPDEPDEAFEELADEHEDECHIDDAYDEEDGVGYPCTRRVANRDLAQVRSK